jgi:hypothetical protein
LNVEEVKKQALESFNCLEVGLRYLREDLLEVNLTLLVVIVAQGCPDFGYCIASNWVIKDVGSPPVAICNFMD